MNEPGWEVENRMARSLGWECVLDPWRGAGWCKFVKGDVWVWIARDLNWVRANLEDSTFKQHQKFSNLRAALSESQD